MSSGGRPCGGVSEKHRRSDQARKHRVAQAPGFTRRTAINLSGGLNELTDERVCSMDAATGAEVDPYRKSRGQGHYSRLSAGLLGAAKRIVVAYD